MAKYRSRGLCRQCYVQACTDKELWRYPKLDDEITDEAYAALLRNPREYVRDYFGESHAVGYDDAQIVHEALRIFNVAAARWRGEEAYVVDPHVIDVEDLVWADAAGSPPGPEPYDGNDATGPTLGPRAIAAEFMAGTGEAILARARSYAPAVVWLGAPALKAPPPEWELVWDHAPSQLVLTHQDRIMHIYRDTRMELPFTPLAFSTCVVRHLQLAGGAA